MLPIVLGIVHHKHLGRPGAGSCPTITGGPVNNLIAGQTLRLVLVVIVLLAPATSQAVAVVQHPSGASGDGIGLLQADALIDPTAPTDSMRLRSPDAGSGLIEPADPWPDSARSEWVDALALGTPGAVGPLRAFPDSAGPFDESELARSRVVAFTAIPAPATLALVAIAIAGCGAGTWARSPMKTARLARANVGRDDRTRVTDLAISSPWSSRRGPRRTHDGGGQRMVAQGPPRHASAGTELPCPVKSFVKTDCSVSTRSGSVSRMPNSRFRSSDVLVMFSDST
jgi:hypothetical protein